ncbi:CBS domain-containing protein [Anaerobranca californiensis DSM 14826]|jgi:CBS domain-containing protein|uniref:CBS domain-containing protein n=1 Tax=Anaerobranca californiensis DSM 14826 TaxID=1120989 RepID=A0A1M6QJH5_9FIRM|nr:CBS domain-containing protein [Anaerobranca californiensis]SHK20444.1 CBS domain-containing protein [Anaerobranca californiensis DSM 14826]
MNIAFFLTPKNEVVYEYENATMRQVMEKMDYHRYTAIPIISNEGKYVATITEGDLLWKMKNTPDITFKDTSKISIKEVVKRTTNRPVSINSNVEDLIELAINQNFVPVIDDKGIFIGIIKRSDILGYCYNKYLAVQKLASGHC